MIAVVAPIPEGSDLLLARTLAEARTLALRELIVIGFAVLVMTLYAFWPRRKRMR